MVVVIYVVCLCVLRDVCLMSVVPSVQDLCMPAMRAQASAIYIGIITIVASIGPVIVSQYQVSTS